VSKAVEMTQGQQLFQIQTAHFLRERQVGGMIGVKSPSVESTLYWDANVGVDQLGLVYQGLDQFIQLSSIHSLTTYRPIFVEMVGYIVNGLVGPEG